MKPAFTYVGVGLLVCLLATFSCQKEYSCENCQGNTNSNSNNNPPSANAGPDQVIVLPKDSVLLNGSASHDPDGSIKKWEWRKIAGPGSFLITTANSVTTSVRSLAAGIYRFELTVTDNGGASGKDTVAVTVANSSVPNRPPVANAGADQTINLPTNTTIVDGSASFDPDNNITGYIWAKLTGPACNIVSTATVRTNIDNLQQGVYLFQLKVTDAGGLFSYDTIQITVHEDPFAVCYNNRPIVNAQLVPFGRLSNYRFLLSPAAAADKIVFAGGYDDVNGNAGLANTIDLYALSTQDWSLSIETPHLNAAVAVSGDKIYFGGGGYYYDDYYSAIDVYDAANNTWGHLSFSEAKTLVAGAAIGDKILFAGGFKTGGDYLPNNIETLVEIYQPSTNTWSSVPLSEPRGGITSTTVNNKVYFAGGWNTAVSNKIDIYDATTNSWSNSTLSYLPTARTAIAYGKNIYWTDGSCKVEVRNVETGASSLESLSRGGDIVPVMKDNKLMFIRLGSRYFDIYDPLVKSWSVGLLPESVPLRAAVISVNNIIYIAGGVVGSIPVGAGSYKPVATNQVWKLEF